MVNGTQAICNECVRLCWELLEDKPKSTQSGKDVARFLNTETIYSELNSKVIGQETAKQILSVAVVNHYKRLFCDPKINLAKSNILMLGPTGSGKTLMAQTIADFLDVPMAIVDVTGLTEAGYVGQDVESVIVKLLRSADGDVARAQQGIVFLDEIDKLSRKSESTTVNRDIGGEGVQQALLKLVEGTSVTVSLDASSAPVEVQTHNILFIAAGAFEGLAEILERKKRNQNWGFEKTATRSVSELPDHADLIKFGMIPELLGRFPICALTQALTQTELAAVISQTPDNLLAQYGFYFGVDGVELEVTAEAQQTIAALAAKQRTGARALRTILENTFRPHLFALPEYRRRRVERITFTSESFLAQRQPTLVHRSHRKTRKISTRG